MLRKNTEDKGIRKWHKTRWNPTVSKDASVNKHQGEERVK